MTSSIFDNPITAGGLGAPRVGLIEILFEAAEKTQPLTETKEAFLQLYPLETLISAAYPAANLPGSPVPSPGGSGRFSPGWTARAPGGQLKKIT
ncbi:MAG: hypothetical protein ACOY9Y_04515 [Bacillota bacterium]